MALIHPKSVEQDKEKVGEQFSRAIKEIQTFNKTFLKPLQVTSNF